MDAARFVVTCVTMAGLIVPVAQLGCSPAEPESSARCDGAIAPIESGFGARGRHAVAVETLRNPRWPDQRVSLHFPREVDGPAPVVLFAHGNDLDDPGHYAALIDHIASRGIAVVFSPYEIGSDVHADRYDAIWSGFEAAADEWSDRLDLTRIGFVGHSYGAGALPWAARNALVERGWGTNGALLFSLAPWYALQITPTELADLPDRLRTMLVVFADDNVTDHRIAISQYHALGDRDDGRQYVLMHADAHGGCPLPAPHTVPQSTGLRARDDALDTHGLFRLFDALAAWAFAGDVAAREIAFGDGSAEQVDLGSWSDGTPVAKLEVSDDPQPSHESTFYLFRIEDRADWIRYGERADPAISRGDAAPAP